MSAGRGIPLLSGSPPPADTGEPSCRKCNKEFNLIFTRSRRCNHCGYLYCHSCTDYQALMPRLAHVRSTPSGHDPVPVCAYCIEDLTITASGKGQLRTYPLAKLRKYAKDYNLNVAQVLEKDELIDILIAARCPNGCLPPVHEDYYRKYSVPNRSNERPRGLFTRAMGAMSSDRPSGTSAQPQPQPPYTPRVRTRTTSQPSFPRPDLDPQRQQQQQQQQQQRQQQQQQQQQQQRQSRSQQPRYHYQQYNPYVANTHSNHRSFPNPYNTDLPPRQHTPPQAQQQRQSGLNVPQSSIPRPRSASASAPRSAPSASANARAPSPTIPTLDELLEMPHSALSALSISTLKTVLYRNHVPTGLVVEKSELVTKVERLVQDEKAEREAARWRAGEEERELREAVERLEREEEERTARERDGAQEKEREVDGEAAAGDASDCGETKHSPSPSFTDPAVTTATDLSDTPTSLHPTASSPTPSATRTSSPSPLRGKMTPKAQAMASHLERTGLCVICQDEEANIAIVDCGHLAMCRTCADLIMGSTRECPLCRTRIVTDARLLRIFKS